MLERRCACVRCGASEDSGGGSASPRREERTDSQAKRKQRRRRTVPQTRQRARRSLWAAGRAGEARQLARPESVGEEGSVQAGSPRQRPRAMSRQPVRRLRAVNTTCCQHDRAGAVQCSGQCVQQPSERAVESV